jgi:hypothetical protein
MAFARFGEFMMHDFALLVFSHRVDRLVQTVERLLQMVARFFARTI